MHNLILKFFNYIRQFLHFLQIIVLFCMLTLFLFWAQNLTQGDWAILNSIEPFLNKLLDIGSSFTQESIDLFDTVFELKYLASFLILLIFYIVLSLAKKGTNLLENLYNNTRINIKQTKEKILNKQLKDSITSQEKKIKQYKIFIATSIKKRFNNSNFKIDLEEQNKIMNKFIIEKTGVNPIVYKNGFLYSFFNFDAIDNILDVFTKIKNTKTPLDYTICIQVFGTNVINEMVQLDKLISLDTKNKITIMADTSYRYKYNENKKYKTSQIGIFQSDSKNKTFEVHEFYLL